MKGVITICGSYKFVEDMYRAYREETEKGKIVLMPAINCNNMTIEEKHNLHDRKIILSDAILVVTREWYVGKDTQREIDFAMSLNKLVEIKNYTTGEILGFYL